MTRELLFVVPQREYGGLHRLVELLSGPLEAEGIRTSALVPAGSDVPGRVDPQVRVIASELLRNPPSPRRPLALARHVLASRRTATRIAAALPARPDLVHVFGFTDILGPGIAARTGAAWVRSANSSIVRPAADRYARAAMARADGTLFEGTGLARRYRPRGTWTPSAIFYPAVAPGGLDGAASRRAALGIPDDVVLVGTWSNVTRQKGLTTFVRYADEVARRRGDVHFLVAGRVPPGHDPYLQRVRDEVAARPALSGRVHLAVDGELDRASVFATIDVLAQTSRYEGVATSTVEAMVAGLPVVAHDVGSVADLVTTGETGHLIPPGDDAAFADAVVALAAAPEQGRQMGQAGARRAGALCSEEALVDAYLGVYRQVLARADR